MEEVTRILQAVDAGDSRAAERLLPVAYDELRRIAANKMKGERAGHTLQPTALVHEAYLRLAEPDGSQPKWNSRGHFFVAAAEAMRRILIESIRRKQSLMRGGLGEVPSSASGGRRAPGSSVRSPTRDSVDSEKSEKCDAVFPRTAHGSLYHLLL